MRKFTVCAALGFELRASCLLGRLSYGLNHYTDPFFVMGFSQDRVLGAICPGLSSNPPSGVARITDMTHQCPAGLLAIF
jgi:hypothetical protein